MKKKGIPVMNVGIYLLILIFMTLALLTFSVLSLENAVADRRKYPTDRYSSLLWL